MSQQPIQYNMFPYGYGGWQLPQYAAYMPSFPAPYQSPAYFVQYPSSNFAGTVTNDKVKGTASLYASAAAAPSMPFYAPNVPIPSASLYASAMAAPSMYIPEPANQGASPQSQRRNPIVETPIFNASSFNNTNIYASMPGNAVNSALYSSSAASAVPKSGASTSIYASMPSLPTNVIDGSKTTKKAVVSEGHSTVGLMFWPQKKELIITGLKEGTSAFTSGLQSGDIIASVDDENVEGLDPEDVALKMAGPTGSQTKIKTKEGREVILTRDVSADEANNTTLDVARHAGRKAQNNFLTPYECLQFRMPLGSVWGSIKAAEKTEPKAADPPAPTPQPAEVKLRYLTPQECKQYKVPLGSRYIPKNSPTVDKSAKIDGESKTIVRQEVEM